MHTNVRAHRGSTPRGHIGVTHESPPTHLWKLRLRAAGGKRGTQPMVVRASSTAALSAGVRAAKTSGAADGSLQAMEAGVPNPLHRRGSKHWPEGIGGGGETTGGDTGGGAWGGCSPSSVEGTHQKRVSRRRFNCTTWCVSERRLEGSHKEQRTRLCDCETVRTN